MFSPPAGDAAAVWKDIPPPPSWMPGLAGAFQLGNDVFLVPAEPTAIINPTWPSAYIMRYDTTTATYHNMSAIPNRWGPSVVWDARSRPLDGCATGCAYILGGYTTDWSSANSIQKYNPATDTLSTLSATLPFASSDITAQIVGSLVYLFGGGSGGNKIVRFNIDTESVITLSATLPGVTYRAASSYDPVRNRIYVFGGDDSHYYAGRTSNRIVIFDLSSSTVTTAKSVLPTPRSGAAAFWDGANTVVFGGITEISGYCQIQESSSQDYCATPLEACGLDPTGGTCWTYVGYGYYTVQMADNLAGVHQNHKILSFRDLGLAGDVIIELDASTASNQIFPAYVYRPATIRTADGGIAWAACCDFINVARISLRSGSPLAVYAFLTPSGIQLTWAPPSPNSYSAPLDGHRVYRLDGSGTWIPLGTTNQNSFTDPTCIVEDCAYRVAAFNAHGEGLPSKVVRLSNPVVQIGFDCGDEPCWQPEEPGTPLPGTCGAASWCPSPAEYIQLTYPEGPVSSETMLDERRDSVAVGPLPSMPDTWDTTFNPGGGPLPSQCNTTSGNKACVVLFIAGYADGGADLLNLDNYWPTNRIEQAYIDAGYAVHKVALYGGECGADKNAAVAGPESGPHMGDAHDLWIPTSHPEQPASGCNGSNRHDRNTDIRHMANHLAWFIYNEYEGAPIDIVAHSMGGMVVRSMMEFAKNNGVDEKWPPALNVETIIGLANPHDGANGACLLWRYHAGFHQQRQMCKYASFTRHLRDHVQNPRDLDGTKWVLVSSSRDEVVMWWSAMDMDAPKRYVYWHRPPDDGTNVPCSGGTDGIEHMGYMGDPGFGNLVDSCSFYDNTGTRHSWYETRQLRDPSYRAIRLIVAESLLG